ncbi:PAQR family membrane homeostasis protein TrhA [Oceanibium sediminis]|uniref:PAQR family membrane homeostasis protein TrhA n=1 Tax=Oceanibium sediminis TaxID=2026339 RepID=UPI000DD30957|nr:hemolysin III family protein [Oceanibium sediminis]
MKHVRKGYTPAEKFSDATIHILGVTWALVGVFALIPLAVFWSGERSVILATMVYGLCMLAMLAVSATYHMSPPGEWHELLQKLDHSAIYIKIAGTYTPFAILSGAPVWMLVMLLWGGACIGILLKMLAPNRFIPLALGLYIAMGWSGVAVGEFVAALRPEALYLMLFGGVLYTGGVVFFLWEDLPFHKTIWHALVLLATVLVYAALVTELAGARTI